MSRFTEQDEKSLKEDFRHVMHKLSLWEIDFIRDCTDGKITNVSQNINAVSHRAVGVGLLYAARENQKAVIRDILPRQTEVKKGRFFIDVYNAGYYALFDDMVKMSDADAQSIRQIFDRSATEMLYFALKAEEYDFVGYMLKRFGRDFFREDVLIERLIHNDYFDARLKLMNMLSVGGDSIAKSKSLCESLLLAATRLDDFDLYTRIKSAGADPAPEGDISDGSFGERAFRRAIHHSFDIFKDMLENHIDPNSDMQSFIETAYYSKKLTILECISKNGWDCGDVELNGEFLATADEDILTFRRQILLKENFRDAVQPFPVRKADKTFINFVKADRFNTILEKALRDKTRRLPESALLQRDEMGHSVIEILCHRGQISSVLKTKLWKDPMAVYDVLSKHMPLRFKGLYSDELKHFHGKAKVRASASTKKPVMLKRRIKKPF